MYACDFETRNEIPASVWHWGYAEIGNINNFDWGTDIDSFMEWLSTKNDTIYFHNLAHDGAFIVHWLLTNGFEHNTERKHRKGTFKTLISKLGAWYSIEICWEDKRSRRVISKIHDSFKKLPFALSKVAKDLKLPMLKGEIDYNKHRPIGYEPDENEIEYLKNDCQILALALEVQFEENLTKMTIGSDCLNTYKEFLGNGDVKKGEKKYRKMFPILDDYIDRVIRDAYRGGWTYVNDKYKGLLLSEGIILDVNSEYPWAMRHNLMPYGTPLFFSGEYQQNDHYPLYVQVLKCSFEIKEDHLPLIQIKKSLHFKGNEYLKSSDGLIVTLSLTNIDLEMFFKHYDVYDIEYVHGFMFKGAYGMYDDYIDYFVDMKIKSDNEPTLRMKSKLLLNNLYGKTGSSPDVTGKVPKLIDGVVHLVTGEEEKADPQYVPTATFTTAYARRLIITSAQENYDRFIYCDTDSVHFVGTEIPENMVDKIHHTDLGYFDLEHTFKRAKYLVQKTYIYEAYVYDDDGNVTGTETIVKGAGMTDEVKQQLNFDNFELGVTLPGLKKSRMVEGGKIIEEKMFTLRERGLFM